MPRGSGHTCLVQGFSINHTTCTYSSGTKSHSSETHWQTANFKFPDSSSVPTSQSSPSKDEVSGLLCTLLSAPSLFPTCYSLQAPFHSLSFPIIQIQAWKTTSPLQRSAHFPSFSSPVLWPSASSDGYHDGCFIPEYMGSSRTTATRQGPTRLSLPKTSDGVFSKLTAKRHVYSGNTELRQRHLRAQVRTFLCEPTQNPGYYGHDFSRIGHRLANSENMV